MPGLYGADVATLQTLSQRLSATSARLISALAFVLLAGTSCSSHSSTAPATATTTQEATVNSSCTGSGSYRIVLSVPGSTPGLPHSDRGREYTPVVGLAGTKPDAKPPTADLSLAADAPQPAPAFHNNLELGSEASLNGYTIKITSICDGEVLFDLVSQPG